MHSPFPPLALWLCCAMASAPASAQTSDSTLTFGDWYGLAYRMSTEQLNAGFRPDILAGEPLAELGFERLDFPETNLKDAPFPGLPGRSYGFGMMLEGTAVAARAGCYSLSLASDDGSLLWIDDRLAVDNGGPHQLRTATDTVHLTAGEHAARLWYYNAFPPLYAMSIDSEPCARRASDTLTLNAAALFASDEHALSPRAAARLDSLLLRLNGKTLSDIYVIGHTDAEGDDDYNLRLSTRRAEAVANYLRAGPGAEGGELHAEGRGEGEPVGDNATAAGRRANRRVEIVVSYGVP